MIRLGEFDVVSLIFYYLILLAIVAQIETGRSVLDITAEHCLKYCNQDCAKYYDSVLLVGKRFDNAQKEREECELAQMWCECNPEPSEWGLDCHRYCHNCKLQFFTRNKILCEEAKRRCDCGPILSQPGSDDNRLWASFGRLGISLWFFVVLMSLVLRWKRHVQAKNQVEIGNRRRRLRNERQRINSNSNACTNNTSCPPTTSTEPIIPRETPSAETRAENEQQAPTPRPTSLVDIAPPPEYEPPPPYPGNPEPDK